MINSLSSDFLIRIKNAYGAGKKSITAPYSKFVVAIAEVLKKNGYLSDYSVNGENKKEVSVKLAYNNNEPSLNNVYIYSKPGRRYYEKSSSLPWGKTQKSLIIISTSSGLKTQKEARKMGLGGELIAEIF